MGRLSADPRQAVSADFFDPHYAIGRRPSVTDGPEHVVTAAGIALLTDNKYYLFRSDDEASERLLPPDTRREETAALLTHLKHAAVEPPRSVSDVLSEITPSSGRRLQALVSDTELHLNAPHANTRRLANLVLGYVFEESE
jgi:hypothetical protein